MRSRDVGSHFLAEVNGGGTLVGGRGLMVGGLLGVGGKLRALPFRFYLVGEFAYSSSADEGLSPTLGVSFRDQRARRELAAGLRIYLPVFGPLRIFADLLGGGSYLTTSLDRQGMAPLLSSGWEGLAVAAAGLQVRVIPQLSLGGRARFALTGEDADGLRVVMGKPSSRPISFMASMTWHF